MAKQVGPHFIKGTIGDLTFYQFQGIWCVRMKSSLSKKRIMKDPHFKRTRENSIEFAQANKAARLWRSAFGRQLHHARDGRLSRRMLPLMMQITKTDQQSRRGERNVANGNLHMLSGLECNEQMPFAQTFTGQYKTSIHRSNGIAETRIPAFDVHKLLNFPTGATHCIFNATIAQVDFKKNTYHAETVSSAMISCKTAITKDMVLTNRWQAINNDPAFLLLGITFFCEVNRVLQPMKAVHNSLYVASVDTEKIELTDVKQYPVSSEIQLKIIPAVKQNRQMLQPITIEPANEKKMRVLKQRKKWRYTLPVPEYLE